MDGTDTTKPIQVQCQRRRWHWDVLRAVLFDNMTVSNASPVGRGNPGTPEFSTSCNNRLSNCTIVSDWPDWGGTAKWNQVTLAWGR